jgi:hypothetical protein
MSLGSLSAGKKPAEVQALREAMAKEGKQPVSFPLDEKYLRATCTSLPHAIRIEHGRITIEVAEGTPDEMQQLACQFLYELAMALNNDPDSFRDLIAVNNDSPSSIRCLLQSLGES